MRMTNKIVLVTGAAQGLGRAISERMLKEGAKVVATDINTAVLSDWSSPHDENLITLKQDVTSSEDWQNTIKQTEEKFGSLHILVNSAGMGLIGNPVDTTLDMWRKTHAVDLDSIFIGCKTALPLMEQTTQNDPAGTGAIVNISSISAVIANQNMTAYNSAKAAVCHYTKSLALHCAKRKSGIRCNSVLPTFVKTPLLTSMAGDSGISFEQLEQKLSQQIPVGRLIEPEEIAAAVAFLASDEAQMITGTDLIIDGGISAT